LTGVQKLDEELEGDRILILQDHLLSRFQDFWREHLLKDRASTKEEILVDGEHLLMWAITNVKTDYLRTHFTARRVRCNYVKTENDHLLTDETFRLAMGKDQGAIFRGARCAILLARRVSGCCWMLEAASG